MLLTLIGQRGSELEANGVTSHFVACGVSTFLVLTPLKATIRWFRPTSSKVAKPTAKPTDDRVYSGELCGLGSGEIYSKTFFSRATGSHSQTEGYKASHYSVIFTMRWLQVSES